MYYHFTQYSPTEWPNKAIKGRVDTNDTQLSLKWPEIIIPNKFNLLHFNFIL